MTRKPAARRRYAVAVVAVVGLAACSDGAPDESSSSTLPSPTLAGATIPPEATTSTTPPTTVAKEVHQFSGAGQKNSDPVQIRGGSYIVTWKGSGTCFYGASLNPTSGGPGGRHSLGSGTGPIEQTDNVYGVPAGEYFLEMISGPAPGCPWTLTLEAR